VVTNPAPQGYKIEISRNKVTNLFFVNKWKSFHSEGYFGSVWGKKIGLLENFEKKDQRGRR